MKRVNVIEFERLQRNTKNQVKLFHVCHRALFKNSDTEKASKIKELEAGGAGAAKESASIEIQTDPTGKKYFTRLWYDNFI